MDHYGRRGSRGRWLWRLGAFTLRVWRGGTRPVRWLAVGAGALLAGYVAWSFIRDHGNCLTFEMF